MGENPRSGWNLYRTKDSEYRVTEENTEGCIVGQEYPCFSNQECADVLLDNRGWDGTDITEMAVFMIVAGVGCTVLGFCALGLACMECNDCCTAHAEYMTFYAGQDRMIYYKDYWDEKMTFSQKLDYFIAYYGKMYDLTISNDISNLIMLYEFKLESVTDKSSL